MLDSATYLMHREAIEGGVFYQNLLASRDWCMTYFPISKGSATYWQDPHISFPVVSDVINRLASLIHSGMQITCNTPAAQGYLDAVMQRNDWEEFSRELVVSSLGWGNHLVVLRVGYGGIRFETWSGEYVFRDMDFGLETIGYMYALTKDGLMQPVVSEPKGKELESIRTVRIDEYLFGGFEHNFGFTPAVLFRAVDKDRENRYGKAYHLRARDQIVQYNQTYSQCAKSMLILQNVWKTNKDWVDDTNPIRLDADTMNYLGEKGTLEQTVRNLDLQWEFSALDKLKAHISASFQVPDFMTGLAGVGKVESGVALSIVSAPLMELVERIKCDYEKKIKELLAKATIAEAAFHGVRLANPELEVEFNDNILPIDKQVEIGNLISAIGSGVITAAEARYVMLSLLGLDNIPAINIDMALPQKMPETPQPMVQS